MMTDPTTRPNRANSGKSVHMRDIARVLRESDSIVVGTHENPDGDAIGSARAAELLLLALGKDVVVYVPHGVIPKEYEFVRPDRLVHEVPADIESRTLLAVDCGNAQRLASPELVDRARVVLNVDHHADNTHFGDHNLVRGMAACSTQLVRELAAELGIELTVPFATAIYVGLVTDTGRFQYSNTTPEAFELAAELVHAGVDTHLVFREVYESIEWPRLKLLSRGLEKARRSSDGRIIATHLTRKDFTDAGADDDSSEGIVDFLRGVEGTHVAVMVRDLATPRHADGTGVRKGSLRTTRDDVDVSIIARSYNGGGHRQAAGFTTDDDLPAIIENVRKALATQGASLSSGAAASAGS